MSEIIETIQYKQINKNKKKVGDNVFFFLVSGDNVLTTDILLSNP
jgi:hypothetical protein